MSAWSWSSSWSRERRVAVAVANGSRGEGAQIRHEGRGGGGDVVVRSREEHAEALEQLRKRECGDGRASVRVEGLNGGRGGARFGAKDRGVSVGAFFFVYYSRRRPERAERAAQCSERKRIAPWFVLGTGVFLPAG